MSFKTISAWALVFVSTASFAFAGPGEKGEGKGKGRKGAGEGGKPAPGQMFDRLDKNKDGNLSKSEVPPKMQERFAELDKNGNELLSKEELMAGRGKGPRGNRERTPEGFLKRFDADNSGTLTKSELPEKMATHFDRIDADGNGSVDTAEIKAMMEKRGNREGKGGGKPGKGKNKGPKGEGKTE